MKRSAFWFLVIVPFFFAHLSLFSQAAFNLTSPDGRLTTNLVVGDFVEFEVMYDSTMVMGLSRISMNVNEHDVLGLAPKIRKKITSSVNRMVVPVVPEKFDSIAEQFNEMKLVCKGDYSIVFRAYNNGITWRFETSYEENIRVNRELVDLNFPKNSNVWFPEEESFFSHNERYYLYEDISLISSGRFCSLPALVETTESFKVLITESNLKDYPGMWLKGTGSEFLKATFPGASVEEEQTSDRDVKVTRHADYLAVTNGTRVFPWRILAVATEDAGLLTNQLSYLLAEPCALEDASWIKPGKVAWDWWNAWNIYGVEFKAGVNTQTYKYYIDFASKYGIEYIIMDEGWYELGDLLEVVPEINMEEILDYAKEKNVGIILWVVWKTLENQWDEVFDQFEKWDVKGIKVDFMQRDDQGMVNYYWRVAEEAARRKVMQSCFLMKQMLCLENEVK